MGADMTANDAHQAYAHMRRSGFIEALMMERKHALCSLRWYIACDDSDDADQQAVVDQIHEAVDRIPRFDVLRLYLAEDRWSNRYASKLTWGLSKIAGRQLMTVVAHEPVDGDSITDDQMTLSGSKDMIVSLFFGSLSRGIQLTHGIRREIRGIFDLRDTLREIRLKDFHELVSLVRILDRDRHLMLDNWIVQTEGRIQSFFRDCSSLRDDATAQQDTLTDQLVGQIVKRNDWQWRGQMLNGKLPFEPRFVYRMDAA
jgi:hypothetical protein